MVYNKNEINDLLEDTFKVEIIAGSGGIGKSTLAISLATWWANDGAKVAVIDQDESQGLTDAMAGTDYQWDIIRTESQAKDYDILIIDNRPATDIATSDPDVVIYPMIPEVKSLKSFERTKKSIKTPNVVFVCSRADMRIGVHKENWIMIRNKYNATMVKETAWKKKVMAQGGNWLKFPRTGAYYEFKNEIGLIAGKVEAFL